MGRKVSKRDQKLSGQTQGEDVPNSPGMERTRRGGSNMAKYGLFPLNLRQLTELRQREGGKPDNQRYPC